jgi:ribosomal protein L11 methyltransferase
MDTHLEILIPTSDPAQKDILIAELSDLGFEGFEEEEILLHAFVKQHEFRENQFNLLMEKFGLNHEKKMLPDQNWNESWEKNFEPVTVGNFCTIRSAFHKPDHHTLFEIVITPKMSFGTGHHATTYLMIEAMENLDIIGNSVLDFGTGTGILAILAEKLGAAVIRAIDNDDWSIANTKENLEVNKCRLVLLEKASTIPEEMKYDLVLANINKNVIFKNLRIIKQQMNKDGVLLLSGLLIEDLRELTIMAGELNIQIEEVKNRDNWICARIRKIDRN